MSALDGCWAKLERAVEHFQALDADLKAWRGESVEKGEAIGARWELDNESRLRSFYVETLPETPRFRWGLILGDVIHNQRSALDQLAWELANLYRPDREEENSTQFPIVLSAKHFAKPHIQRQVQFIDPAHVVLIEQKQPYAGGNTSPGDHTLAVLQNLSNADKHRGISIVQLAPDISSFRTGIPFTIRNGTLGHFILSNAPLEPGAKFMEMRADPLIPGGPEPDVYMHGDMSPSIAIKPGGMLKYVLPNITQTVANVLKTFEPVF
jgi:hypothetical protein